MRVFIVYRPERQTTDVYYEVQPGEFLTRNPDGSQQYVKVPAGGEAPVYMQLDDQFLEALLPALAGRPAPSGPPRPIPGVENIARREPSGEIGLRAERDELRARLTVVEAERDAAQRNADANWNRCKAAEARVEHERDDWKRICDDYRAALAACREQNTTLREALERRAEP